MISRFERFSNSIFCIYRDIQKIQRTEMARYGMKGAHTQCLLVMSHHPEGITASQLSEICDKDKAAISRTVAELEQKGLVQREVKSNGGYRAALKLTDLGREAACHVKQRAECAVEKAGEGLSDAQREVLYHTLDLLAANLQEICQEGL